MTDATRGDHGAGVGDVPTATYRIQLRSGMTFERLRGFVDYFADLGVSDLYLSPIFRAESGSAHGYATVDYGEIDPRVGSLDSLAALAATLRSREMGLILDIVPNHMCASPSENAWWRDVLELGRSSPFARYFDIDWNPPDPALREKVLAPLLTKPYEDALFDAVGLRFDRGGLHVRCGEERLPVSLATWSAVLPPFVGHTSGRALSSALRELQSLERSGTVEDTVGQRKAPIESSDWERKEQLKERLLTAVNGSPSLRSACERACEEINSDPRRLDEILSRQYYVLSPWQAASGRLNYRRFFDINSLVRVRVEDEEVFDAVHRLAFTLLERQSARGLRVDHVDGLRDPGAYLRKLPRSTYVVVEKILERDERLRSDWSVAGTSGYEVLNRIHRLFVDPRGERALQKFFVELAGSRDDFEDVVFESKRLVMRDSFAGEMRALSRDLRPLLSPESASDPADAPPLQEIMSALENLIAGFPVYRTYVPASRAAIDEIDRLRIVSGAAAARRRNPGLALIDSLASVLLLDEPVSPSPELEAKRHEVVLRVQQLTGAVTAKGVEDTAFYRYFPLLSVNEVGGGPRETSSDEPRDHFHLRNHERVEANDLGLSASSTHDTKRDEDVRARIAVLSERPREWREAVGRWRRLNRRHKALRRDDGADREVPDASEEYLLYQTLLGTWPMEPLDETSHGFYMERIQSYMNKALREAKRNTSWQRPDLSYENGVATFIEKILDPQTGFRFIEHFSRFEAELRSAGLWNSLAQLALKATVPGVPDFYQGTELYALRLVDPDNRVPVDFERRRQLLIRLDEDVRAAGRESFVKSAKRHLEDGRLKLFLTRELARFRREHRDLFEKGSYREAVAEGRRASHVVAFTRRLGATEALVAVGRYYAELASAERTNGSIEPAGESVWGDTRVCPHGPSRARYRDALTERTLDGEPSGLPLSRVFALMPIAVLLTEPRHDGGGPI